MTSKKNPAARATTGVRSHARRGRTTPWAATASLVAAFLVAGDAAAAGYIGMRAGEGKGNESIGRTGGAAELFAGYRFTDRWSVEGSYLERQANTRRAAVWGGVIDGDAELQALTVSVRGDFPIASRWRVHARSGVAFSHVDQETRFEPTTITLDPGVPPQTADVVPARIRTEGDDVGWVVGLGVDYALSKRWSLGLEAQYLGGDFVLGCGPARCGFDDSGSMRLISLGLTAEF